MKNSLGREDKYLLQLIRQSLQVEQENQMVGAGIDWEKLFFTAKKHAVLSLLYDVLSEDEKMPLQGVLNTVSRQTVQQSYHLLFLTAYLVEIFEKSDIQVIVLKGVGTASLYPVPELRKSGDIDLLLADTKDLEKAKIVLEQNGFWLDEEQKSQHHYAYVSKDKITVELHDKLAGPFDNEKTTRILEEIQAECKDNYSKAETMGMELPLLNEAYQAYYLLLHMLQHFLRAGFGLKLLCDWVVFWKRPLSEEDKEKFMELATRTGLVGFAKLVTQVCIEYIGLEEGYVNFLLEEKLPKSVVKDFMWEIFEAQEFGKSSTDRMVVVRGKGIGAYLREFHHQMLENNPKARQKHYAWPFYWIKTFLVFLRNNRRIRKISFWQVLKNARKRSNIVVHLKLFK